jgi:hypothetical protein
MFSSKLHPLLSPWKRQPAAPHGTIIDCGLQIHTENYKSQLGAKKQRRNKPAFTQLPPFKCKEALDINPSSKWGIVKPIAGVSGP